MSTLSLTTLDPSVSARLSRVARRIRVYVVIEGIAWLAIFLLAAALLQFGLDYTSSGLRWSMRAALLAAIVGAAITLVLFRIANPLRLRFGLGDIAHLVERSHPQLNSLLVSAVRFSQGQVGPPESNSSALVASVLDNAGRQARNVDFDQVVNSRRMRRAAIGIGMVAGICLVMLWAAPRATSLWFSRNVLLREIPWPKRTTLVVDIKDGVLLAPRGDDVVITAQALGEQPREVDIFFEMPSGQRGRHTMITVGSEGAYRYRHTFEKAHEDFVFHLRGGDDRTDGYQVRLLERPKVETTEMQIIPPQYSRIEPFTLGDGQRSAQVLRGSQVTVRASTNHPVTRASLVAGDKPVAEATREGDRYAATVSPSETHTYYFQFLDDAGLENREQVRFSIQVIKDEPPRVRMKLPGVGEMITPEAVLPIELAFEDVYGLATAEMVHQISREGSEEQSQVPPSFKPEARTLSASLSWAVSSVGVVPGERLTLFARASDFDTVSGPNAARSQEFALRVVTRDELLAALARREREFRADFERLVDAQEQLRGRLLTSWGRFTDEERVEGVRDALLAHERTQRNVAGSVNVVRQQFERILAELQINQLDTAETRERVDEGIVAPLAQVVKRDLVLAADTIGQWSAMGSLEAAAQVDPQQVEILAQLRTILAKMVYREGYQEVVNMLRDIIRLQQDLNAESKKAMDEQGREIFDE